MADREKISLLIFEEAKASLESSIVNSDKLEKKIFFWGGLYVAGMSTVAALISKGTLSLPLLCMFVGFLLAFLLLRHAFKTKKYAAMGMQASPLLEKPWNSMAIDALYESIALSYEEKAAHNNAISAEKSCHVNRSTFCLISFLVLAVVILIVPLVVSMVPVFFQYLDWLWSFL